jgi:dihydropteroate synthase
MANHNPSNGEEKSLDETLQHTAKLADHIADTIDTGFQETEDSSNELESKFEEAKESNQKRRDALEDKHEQIRQNFRKKWKRY